MKELVLKLRTTRFSKSHISKVDVLQQKLTLSTLLQLIRIYIITWISAWTDIHIQVRHARHYVIMTNHQYITLLKDLCILLISYFKSLLHFISHINIDIL